MLLKIDVNKDDILYCENGRIIVQVHHYGPFAHGCHLATLDGSTMEEFNLNKAKKGRSVFVGVNGGISLG